jgi:hydroxypyruvate reductase
MDPRRRILCAMAAAALARVGGRAAVRRALGNPDPPGHARTTGPGVAVIAIGKAAGAMLQGAEDALGAALSRAILITKDSVQDAGRSVGADWAAAPAAGTAAPQGARPGTSRSTRPGTPQGAPDPPGPPPRYVTERLHTSHPLPDARSVAAGEHLFDWIAELQAGQPVLLLLSGGASSLVELPRPGVTLQQIRALTEQGLRTGLDIATLNAERARLSRIKGGGLTAALAGHPGRALFISDVPGDDPAVIGGGLAGPLPGAAGGRGKHLDLLHREVVANVEAAVGAAQARAQGLGLAVEVPAARFAGLAVDLGRSVVARFRASRAEAWVAGGETVVQLPPSPGRGGRNQQVALAAALDIRGAADLLLMALGTDGNDGPTEDAGGLVDGSTCARIMAADLDPAAALARADAGTALELAGDLVTTGPTGTNVGDLVLALRLTETRAAELLAARGEVPVPML